jgi:hypothetical protein
MVVERTLAIFKSKYNWDFNIFLRRPACIARIWERYCLVVVTNVGEIAEVITNNTNGYVVAV